MAPKPTDEVEAAATDPNDHANALEEEAAAAADETAETKQQHLDHHQHQQQHHHEQGHGQHRHNHKHDRHHIYKKKKNKKKKKDNKQKEEEHDHDSDENENGISLSIGLNAVLDSSRHLQETQQQQQQHQRHLSLKEFLNDKIKVLTDTTTSTSTTTTNNNNFRQNKMFPQQRTAEMQQLYQSFLQTIGLGSTVEATTSTTSTTTSSSSRNSTTGTTTTSSSKYIISLVVGDGGVGKTSLVEHAFGYGCTGSSRGSSSSGSAYYYYYFFLKGKFDPLQDPRPLAPISQALEQLTDQILAVGSVTTAASSRSSGSATDKSSAVASSSILFSKLKQNLGVALRQAFEMDDLVTLIRDGIWSNLHHLLDVNLDLVYDLDLDRNLPNNHDVGGSTTEISTNTTTTTTTTFYLTMMITIWRTIIKCLHEIEYSIPMIVVIDNIDQVNVQSQAGSSSGSSSNYVEFFELLKHLLVDTAAFTATTTTTTTNSSSKSTSTASSGGGSLVHFVLSFRPVSSSHPINDVLRHVEEHTEQQQQQQSLQKSHQQKTPKPKVQIEFSPIILSSLDDDDDDSGDDASTKKIMSITKGNPSMINLLMFQQNQQQQKQQQLNTTNNSHGRENENETQRFIRTLDKIERRMKKMNDYHNNDDCDNSSAVSTVIIISSIIDQLLRVKSSTSLCGSEVSSESNNEQVLFGHHDRTILNIAACLGEGCGCDPRGTAGTVVGSDSHSNGNGNGIDSKKGRIDLELLQQSFSAMVSSTTPFSSSSSTKDSRAKGGGIGDDYPNNNTNNIDIHIKLNQHRELVKDCMDKYVRYGIIEKVTVSVPSGVSDKAATATTVGRNYDSHGDGNDGNDGDGDDSWEKKVLETKKKKHQEPRLQQTRDGREKKKSLIVFYKFVCSTYQKAIYEMISEDQKSKIHSRIGHVLLQDRSMVEDETSHNRSMQLMRSMSHLQLGCSTFSTLKDETINFAMVALKCGNLAKRWRLYHTSCEYYANGLKSLQRLPIRHGDSVWSLNYELVLQLTLGLATCCLHTDSYDDTKQFHSEICDHVSRKEDKAKADMLLIEMYTKQHRYQEAVELCEHTLAGNLGVSIAHNITMDDTKRTFCKLVGLEYTEEGTTALSDDEFESSILRILDSITAVIVQPHPRSVTAMKVLSMMLGPVVLQTKPQNNDEIEMIPFEGQRSDDNSGNRTDILSVLFQMMKLVLCPGGCGSTSLTQLTLSSLTSLFTSTGCTMLARFCETLRQSLLLVAEGTSANVASTSALPMLHIVDKSCRGRCLLFENGLLQMPAGGRKSQNQLKMSYRLCNDAGDTDVSEQLCDRFVLSPVEEKKISLDSDLHRCIVFLTFTFSSSQ